MLKNSFTNPLFGLYPDNMMKGTQNPSHKCFGVLVAKMDSASLFVQKNVTCQISKFWHKNGVAAKICEFRAGVTKRDCVHFGGINFYGPIQLNLT